MMACHVVDTLLGVSHHVAQIKEFSMETGQTHITLGVSCEGAPVTRDDMPFAHIEHEFSGLLFEYSFLCFGLF